MENLVTRLQNLKLKQVLDDQQISINNIEVDYEVVSPVTDDLIRPFKNTGTIRRFKSFNSWIDHVYLTK
jgi:hypothetical protein